MVTRQNVAKAAVPTNISQEHAEIMLQMAMGKYVSPKKKAITTQLSPQQIADRGEFLLPTGGPLYTADQVQNLLREQAGLGTGGGQPEVPSSPVRASEPPRPAMVPATAPVRFSGSAPAASPATPGIKMTVLHEAPDGKLFSIRLRMYPSRTLQDIHKELTTTWALATPHSFKLHFERADGVMDTPTEIEDVWDLLQDEHAAGRWVFRAITPITPPSARLALEPNSVTSENVSRRLSYDNGDADPAAQLTRALRLQQFEQSVVAEIKAAVKLAVQQYGDKASQAGQFPAETFYKALRVTEDLTKLLDRLTKEALRRADPPDTKTRFDSEGS